MVFIVFIRWQPIQRAFPIGRILPNLPDQEPFRLYRCDFRRYYLLIIITNMMDFSPRCVSLKAGLWPGQLVFDVYWSSGTRFERDTGRYCMGAALFGNFLKIRKSLFVTSKSDPTIKYWYVFQSIGMWAHPRTVGRAIEALLDEYGVVTFWKTWKNDEKRSFQLSRQLHRVLTPIWASQWPVPRYFWWCLGM